MTCSCGLPFTQHSGTMSTLVGFGLTADGHRHDDNCQRRIYVCAAGHRTHLSRQNRCDRCDWRGKLTCFCHAGEKIAEWPNAAPMSREETIAALYDRGGSQP